MKLTIHVVLEEESHGGWSLNKNNIILPIISKKTILKKHNRIIGVVEPIHNFQSPLLKGIISPGDNIPIKYIESTGIRSPLK